MRAAPENLTKASAVLLRNHSDSAPLPPPSSSGPATAPPSPPPAASSLSDATTPPASPAPPSVSPPPAPPGLRRFGKMQHLRQHQRHFPLRAPLLPRRQLLALDERSLGGQPPPSAMHVPYHPAASAPGRAARQMAFFSSSCFAPATSPMGAIVASAMVLIVWLPASSSCSWALRDGSHPHWVLSMRWTAWLPRICCI